MTNGVISWRRARAAFGCACLLIAGSASSAVPIFVYDYAMPNGSGVANGGSFNYWDKFYTGSGNTMTDGAPLTGGVGDLTDGVVAAGPWFTTESVSGDGPYVGWINSVSLDPTISFLLLPYASQGYFRVDEIRVHIDNSEAGGVFAPSDIWVNGQSVAFVEPAPGNVGWVTLTGFAGVTSKSPVSVQLFHDNQWVFASEFEFRGTWVPEPATWAMMIAGFGLVGTAARRRRLNAV